MSEIAATVREHDAAIRAGSVLLDDGRVLDYDAAAFDAGGLRLLRLGQRVRLRIEGDAERGTARILAITLVTLPW